MNLETIDFETAKDLKKLGFDWTPNPNECGQYYTDDGQLIRNNEALQYKKGISDFYLAPTQAEVAKWLRDKYGLYVFIDDFEQAEFAGIKKAIEILKERQDDNKTGKKQN